jgi:hypothetical protein
MAERQGWLGLLAAVGKQFDALSSGQITLTLYVTTERGDFSPNPFAIANQESRRKQVMSGGSLPAGSIFLDRSSYYLYANPQAPDDHFWQRQGDYRDRVEKLAKDAWAILPREVRRLAMGSDGETGWYIIVYRILTIAGVGSIRCGRRTASIEGDLAKASSMAIQFLGQYGVAAIAPPLPSDPKRVRPVNGVLGRHGLMSSKGGQYHVAGPTAG